MRRVRRLAGLALVGAAYWTVVRPRMLNWGATPTEVRRPLAGDALLPEPDGESTMALTIDAPPEDIWPWLRQLGQGRGGFYSYEWAENLVGLDIHNADEIIPEYQDIALGDEVRLGNPERYPDTKLEVAAISPERALVLQSPEDPPWWVWSFVLDPVTETETRLVVRSRISLPDNPALRVASQLVLDPVTFMMTRGMLLGIKSRVEAPVREEPLLDV
ncbi:MULTISPECIES: hypothetical protein [Haloferax]|uniref:hypothetical protein n=1 Tax=Haloferax TaxID=2251 RepID=UPI001CD969FD|nr:MULTISPECIES: hypothetical protein [Haloferax]